uniref:Uncharacterized protein n=1 Tax=Arundo donax TaxID=35708 RepID=A0A0A9GUL8_ARUDO
MHRCFWGPEICFFFLKENPEAPTPYGFDDVFLFLLSASSVYCLPSHDDGGF